MWLTQNFFLIFPKAKIFRQSDDPVRMWSPHPACQTIRLHPGFGDFLKEIRLAHAQET